MVAIFSTQLGFRVLNTTLLVAATNQWYLALETEMIWHPQLRTMHSDVLQIHIYHCCGNYYIYFIFCTIESFLSSSRVLKINFVRFLLHKCWHTWGCPTGLWDATHFSSIVCFYFLYWIISIILYILYWSILYSLIIFSTISLSYVYYWFHLVDFPPFVTMLFNS